MHSCGCRHTPFNVLLEPGGTQIYFSTSVPRKNTDSRVTKQCGQSFCANSSLGRASPHLAIYEGVFNLKANSSQCCLKSSGTTQACRMGPVRVATKKHESVHLKSSSWWAVIYGFFPHFSSFNHNWVCLCVANYNGIARMSLSFSTVDGNSTVELNSEALYYPTHGTDKVL